MCWPGEKAVYSLPHRHVCRPGDLLANWIVLFFLLVDLTFPLPRITWGSCPVSIQRSDRSLVASQFIRTYKRNLTVTLPARTLDLNSVLQTSCLLLLVCEGNKKREREKERHGDTLYLSKIWIWFSPGIYIYIYIYKLHETKGHRQISMALNIWI